MEQQVDITIIGAGTAGLSAYKEANKVTNNILLIDNGPLGTTCARAGCMPSKVLIHVANEFYKQKYFSSMGINNSEKLSIHVPTVLNHVRSLRDRFTNGVVNSTLKLGDNLLRERAEIISPNQIKTQSKLITTKKIIIASGSESIIPPHWINQTNPILTSETIFEQNDLTNHIAVIGGGVIGLELGQALSRLGININLYHGSELLAGLTDPKVNQIAHELFQTEFNLYINQKIDLNIGKTNFSIKNTDYPSSPDQIFAALGRRPNLENLGLDKIGIDLDSHGLPLYNATTMQIADLPIYICGDVNKQRPLLHEAADEGRIAGFNAAREKTQCFKRRVPMHIVFTQPNIFAVGCRYEELKNKNIAIGQIDYSDQGRARVMNANQGILRIYGDKQSGKILGAEGIAPSGEHLAHLLANMIQQQQTVFQALQLPFYHPVIEEGMRTALRDLASQVECECLDFEMAMCDSEAEHSLS